jgi:hypothetical protein
MPPALAVLANQVERALETAKPDEIRGSIASVRAPAFIGTIRRSSAYLLKSVAPPRRSALFGDLQWLET